MFRSVAVTCFRHQTNHIDNVFHPCYTVNDNGNDNNHVFDTVSRALHFCLASIVSSHAVFGRRVSNGEHT